jgi:hypothetical protein
MPSISTITPATFDSGRSVTLTGAGFGASQGSVLIGGQAQSVTAWSDTSITFTTARGSQSLGACRVDVVKGGGAAAFFTDGFESGDRSYTENGTLWLAGTNTSVQSGRGNPGYSLQFAFTGTPDADNPANAIAEQRFEFGQLYQALTVEFDLYIPAGTETWGGAAYTHRTATSGGSNNKFYRVWPGNGSEPSPNDTYNEPGKLGLSLLPEGLYSRLYCDWDSVDDGLGQTQRGTPANGFINASDLGTWVSVKVYFYHAQNASERSSIRVWKNGMLVINENAINNYRADQVGGWGARYGYFLGAANTGFLSTTYLQIDNVKWYGGLV